MQRASVVLPEPDSPTSARHSRGRTTSSTSYRTCRVPYEASTPRTVTSASSTSISGRGCGGRSRGRPRRAGRRRAGSSGPRGRAATVSSGGWATLHASDGVRAARREEAARAAGARAAAPSRGCRRARARPTARGSPRRGGACRDARTSRNSVPVGPDLDEPAAVHDRDAGRERRDDGEIVAHVDGRDAVHRAEVAHRLEHVGLRRDVEAGGRLVEHDHARPVGERHRERDALLLAAGELVRVAPEERRRRSAAAPRRASRRSARAAPRPTRRTRARRASRRAACRCASPG